MKKVKFSFFLLSNNFSLQVNLLQVPVQLPIQAPPAVTEIRGPVVCRPHARWAGCCHPADYLPECSFQKDRAIAKVFASSLPNRVFVVVRFQ